MKRPGLCVAILLVITLAVFWPVVTFDFTSWDDYNTIARNPWLNPPTPQSLKEFWTRPQEHLYAPITYTVWAMLANSAQRPLPDGTATLDPRLFHALNLALHAAAGVLAFLLLRRLVISDAAALVGALLFAVHPVQVETVAWTSGTKDLLCGALSLAALWQYVDFAEGVARDETVPAERWRAWLIATTAFVLAMLSKPTAMVVPVIALALDWFVVQRSWRAALRSLWPWIVLAIPCAVIAKYSQPALHAQSLVPLWTRPLIALDALAFYLFKLLVPAKLAFDYGRMPQLVFEKGWLYWTWIAPLAIAAALSWRRNWLMIAAAIAFLAPLLPVLGLEPFDFQGYSTVADHYLYLSMLGLALAAAYAVTRWRRPALIIAVIALTIFAARSFAQTWHWRDSDHLFAHTLEVNPASFASYNSLAYARMDAGDFPAAIDFANKSIELRRDDVKPRIVIGVCLMQLNDWPAAEHALRQALLIAPDDPRVMSNLAITLIQQNNPAEALPLMQRAAELDTENPSCHLNLANVYASLGRDAEAIASYESALRLAPSNVKAHLNLAAVLIGQSKLDEARRHYQAVLEIDPSNPQAQQALRAIPPPAASQRSP